MIATQESTVGDMVAENPARATVFEKHGIDYCCHGQTTLEEACRRRGLPVETVVSELASLEVPEQLHDWNTQPLTELAEYIVRRHHTYLRSTLPSVEDKLGKVADAHADHRDLLLRLTGIFEALRDELTLHMQKEEMILFPVIARMEAA